MTTLDRVVVLRRYPVKSMLGEELAHAVLTSSGLEGDRGFAVIDGETSRVASAKQPHLWRALLQFGATLEGSTVHISLPDATTIAADDPGVNNRLSQVLGRPVHLSEDRAAGASVARPAPEDVIDHGDDVDVSFETLEIGQGTPGTTFVDYAPVHLMTTTTLEHVGAELVRYRPNVVISTPDGVPYAENDWTGREITIGQVRLRGSMPTPRCAVPTLAHGELPRSNDAVRTLLEHNRVDVPGFGVLPCLGLYAEVLIAGTIRTGDEVRLH